MIGSRGILLAIPMVLLLSFIPCFSQSFSQPTMEASLAYAFAAYQRNDTFHTLSTWTCEGCCALVAKPHGVDTFFDYKTNTFGFVAQPPPDQRQLLADLVVSFRGTVAQSMKNWIEDLDCKTTLWPNTTKDENVLVHKGFLDTYLKVRAQIFSLVDQARLPSDATLLVTGHSLGAALAQIAALDLQQEYPSLVVSTYTFGTPRCGNEQWSNLFSRTIRGPFWRTVHYEDIVPHLPPAFLGFYHTPREAYYDLNFTLGNESICLDPRSQNCSYGTLGRSISDHLCYNHMKNTLCQYCKY